MQKLRVRKTSVGCVLSHRWGYLDSRHPLRLRPLIEEGNRRVIKAGGQEGPE